MRERLCNIFFGKVPENLENNAIMKLEKGLYVCIHINSINNSLKFR